MDPYEDFYLNIPTDATWACTPNIFSTIPLQSNENDKAAALIWRVPVTILNHICESLTVLTDDVVLFT